MKKIKSILLAIILGVIVLFNISSIVNLSLNNQYAVKEIKYIENKVQAEGIYDLVERDYKELIMYLIVQIIIIVIVLIYFVILKVSRKKEKELF